MTIVKRVKVRTRTLLIAGALVALVLAGVFSYYASQSPDGLEKVAADKGIDAKEKPHEMADGPLADYSVKGVHNERVSGGLAGVLGVAGTLLVGTGVFWVVKRRGAPKEPQADTA
ncbi:hypothetical protein GCM10023205_60610 [Yinghuangia aomiensis]|uniref:PDGLE domain-containing protein n=1 Tax=Yinghuangia aomiensis TaxID=676205 RepID=A0ABP9HZP6_9ACTN